MDLSTDGTECRLAELALSEPRLTLLPFGQLFGGAGPNFYRLLRDVDLTDFDYLSYADQNEHWHREKTLASALFDDREKCVWIFK